MIKLNVKSLNTHLTLKQNYKKYILLVLSVIALYIVSAFKNEMGIFATVLTKGCILSLSAVSMNLLTGFTGLFSLGHAGFMSLGAYTTALLLIPVKDVQSVFYAEKMAPWLYGFKSVFSSLPLCLQFILALLISGIVSSVLAFIIGHPILKLKSDYLAIATLGLSEIIRALISSPNLTSVTNGSYGLNRIPDFPSMFFGVIPSFVTPFFIVFLCILFIHLLLKSNYGVVFSSIRDDEIASSSVGIDNAKNKLLSFVVSSFFTSVSGGLLAIFLRSIEARTFSVSLTYEILLIVVVGGLGSISGSVIAAFLITIFKEWLLRFFDLPLYIGSFRVPFFKTGLRLVVYSVLLLLIVLLCPYGIMKSKKFSISTLLKKIKTMINDKLIVKIKNRRAK